MGSWDVRLYDSDTALDVKGDLETWLPIPGTPDDIVRNITAGKAHRFDESDEDYPDFWLALADRFHAYGIDHPETFRRARHVVTSGLDLRIKRALGLKPADEEKRAAVLAALLARWAKPVSKPLKRRVMKEPEGHVFPVGTIFVYPTCGGVARNYADVKNHLGWQQDGWGSAIILAQGRERDWFTWEACARLDTHGKTKPTFAQCREGAIENQPWDMNPSGKGTIALQVDGMPPLHAKRMELEPLGQITLNAKKVAKLSEKITAPKRVPMATFHTVLTWWIAGVKTFKEYRDPNIATPRPAFPLRTLLG